MRQASFRDCVLILCAAMWIAAADMASANAADRGIGDFPKLSAERDWPWWRGPSRNGIAVAPSAPTRFSDSQNVVWKSPVPGRGHSSPIVVGEQVILATASKSPQVQSVLAFDRKSGKQLWKTDISEGGFPERNHDKNTEATPTVACDGERLFATFFHHQTVQCTALDLTGKKVWQKTVQPFNPRRYQYGYAPSPTLYRGSVIVSAEYDGESAITALDRQTGKQLWRTKRTSGITFSTPVVAHVAGKDQLLISGAEQVASYDPATGKPLWTTPGTTAATCGTMVWDGDIVIASGGYPKPETIAVKADGSGQVVWRNQQKCYEQSMLAHEGYVYALNDAGILLCWRANDGQEMWKERLFTGPTSSSPVLVGGNIYWPNERGTWYIFQPNPQKYEPVAENQLGEEGFASPAVVGGQMFVRTASYSGGRRQEWLYCLGK